MKRKDCKVAFSVTYIGFTLVFLSAIFLANANLALAASANNKTVAVAHTLAVDRTESRIKQLQGALKITDAQKDLWNAVTLVMRDNAKEMDALAKDRSERLKMNAVEHMKYYSQLTETHLNQLKKFIPPFEALYAGMSDEQKKTADTLFHKGLNRKNKGK